MLHSSSIRIHLPLMSLIAKKDRRRQPEWWTLIGTWVTLAFFAWLSDGIVPFFYILSHFLTGHLTEVQSYSTTPATPIVAATAVMLVLMVIATSPLLAKYDTPTYDDVYPAKRQLAIHMFALFGEEFMFRFIFLELLTKIPGLDSDAAYYALLLTGNILWAGLHLMTLGKSNRKKWPLVLPMFLGGLIFSMIYASHGFFVTVMTHIIYDVVMFSGYTRYASWYKKHLQRVLCTYHLVWLNISLTCFLTMSNHSILEAWHMLLQVSSGDTPLGWNTTDYLLVAILLISGAFLLLDFLRYDYEVEILPRRKLMHNLLFSGIIMLLPYPVLIGLEALFQGNFTVKVMGIAILLVSLEKVKYLSGVARLFWKSMLVAQLLSIIQVLHTVAIFSFCILIIIYQTGERTVRYGYAFYTVHMFIPLRLSFWISRAKNPKNVEAMKWVLDRLKDESLSSEDRNFYLSGASIMLKNIKTVEKLGKRRRKGKERNIIQIIRQK
jgi:hypothetical protein